MQKQKRRISHKYLDCIKFMQTQRITDTALILSSYTNPRANKKQLSFGPHTAPPLLLYISSTRLFYALPSMAIRILFFT